MGYQFTLILNRKITDDESAGLLAAGCDGASISTVPYPTGADPDLIVTQLDFDDTESSTLEAAITRSGADRARPECGYLQCSRSA